MITLAILIPHLATREKLFRRLLDVLMPQMRDGVAICVDKDNGEVPIGAKRNRMIAKAWAEHRPEYVVHVDDDDLVSVRYVVAILDAIRDEHPDCVGFRMRRFSSNARDEMARGVAIGESKHSLSCGAYGTRELPGGMLKYLRTPNHITPIRTEIVRELGASPFPELNWAEDTEFASRVLPLLRSEVFIDEYLYEYLYRTPYVRTHEHANGKKAINA